ncbi:hypothetical protein IQ279_19405 [Streptomyces verrucosisporus]|uniref:Imm50 family immunity protein n=1 Tax=Streptomyces verrucosisporus TaxID=1695161 RepID=UPI0019CF8194|nr:Imm50 family immunity protein [Streptomyces verrucosisporus]MBN3931769.1 hypothetical protein [Streptomyces verrucosisporus]
MDDMEWRRIFRDSGAPAEILENPPGLNGKAPSYVHVDDRGEGVVVAMGFDFRIPTEITPREWRERNFNALEVSLEFTRVRDIEIYGWARRLDCLITLSRNPGGDLDVKAIGDEEKISFTTERVRISRFRAYRASSPSP